MTWATPLITGLIGIAGIIVGALLDPVRALFTQRAQNRRELVERCATIVRTVELSKRGIIATNQAFRMGEAGQRGSRSPQVMEEVARYNEARRELAVAVAMLRLSGPDSLVEQSRYLATAIDKMHNLSQLPDDQGAEPGGPVPPKALVDAQAALDSSLTQFCGRARKYTRVKRGERRELPR